MEGSPGWQELGFELEVEAAEQGMRASLPLASEEQQRVRLFLAERFSVAEQRRGGMGSWLSIGVGEKFVEEADVECVGGIGSRLCVIVVLGSCLVWSCCVVAR